MQGPALRAAAALPGTRGKAPAVHRDLPEHGQGRFPTGSGQCRWPKAAPAWEGGAYPATSRSLVLRMSNFFVVLEVFAVQGFCAAPISPYIEVEAMARAQEYLARIVEASGAEGVAIAQQVTVVGLFLTQYLRGLDP